MKYLLITLMAVLPTVLLAQKKIIDHTAYKQWKRIGDVHVSADGNYAAYTIKPLEGDGYLYLVNLNTGKRDSFPRGILPSFTGDNKALLFKITPGFDTLRKCELNKVKKDKWPKDSLAIFLTANDSLIKIPKIKEVQTATNSEWFAYLSHDNKMPESKDAKKKKKKKRRKKDGEESKITSDGKLLTVRSTAPGKPYKVINVDHFEFSEKGEKLIFVTQQNNKVDSNEMVVLDLKNNFSELYRKKYPAIGEFSLDKPESHIVYTASMDTIEEGKVYRLLEGDLSNQTETLLVDTVHTSFDAKTAVSVDKQPYYSFDGQQIFFGLAAKPMKAVKDTLLESEKAKLDLWHWQDDRLQPQQLIELKRDLKRSNLTVYDRATKSIRVLESDSLRISHDPQKRNHWALAYNMKPYQQTYNWETPNRMDYYRVNVLTGETTLLGKAVGFGINLSPSGMYYSWYNEKNQQSYLSKVGVPGSSECITCDIKDEWLEDVNGMPMQASPFGLTGWVKPEAGKQEHQLIIASKYDQYLYDSETKKLQALTNVGVSKREWRYNLVNFAPDSVYLEKEFVALTGFNEKDKSSAMYQVNWTGNQWQLNEKHHSDHALTGLRKAEKGDRVLFQLGSLQDYPDLYASSLGANNAKQRLSVTNPQQSEYNWATVELISWKSYSGIPLQGLLYKPENYDPAKKYPLMVYYYELYSDDIHNHYAPKPTASIIYPTEYASAGYFVLIPDIRYQPGHPAKGAYDCIMSATDAALKLYPCIDSTRMGLQGQSWGGYQTAQLVTMTNRYKAAMAGAPVSNMFSAYGGIRWGSGLNRQFQYERTQSRIGKTIWEAPELYVENSPLFHLPKVQTPLLIMSNDQDGAVPWYQGIELFTGLRRLGKPTWMLNYNDDDHNLTKMANKIDLSIRMRQFFDYYLLDKPAPVWLIDGLPAVDKGKKYNLDYKQ